MAAVPVGPGVTYYPPREASALRGRLRCFELARRGGSAPSFRSSPPRGSTVGYSMTEEEAKAYRWEPVMNERVKCCHASTQFSREHVGMDFGHKDSVSVFLADEFSSCTLPDDQRRIVSAIQTANRGKKR